MQRLGEWLGGQGGKNRIKGRGCAGTSDRRSIALMSSTDLATLPRRAHGVNRQVGRRRRRRRRGEGRGAPVLPVEEDVNLALFHVRSPTCRPRRNQTT